MWPSHSFPVRGSGIISIHTPFAGCDFILLSRISVQKYFNPHTLCRVWRRWLITKKLLKLISIHTPFAGCDNFSAWYFDSLHKFQSTHPLQGVTSLFHVPITFPLISIHTPFAGCDTHFLENSLLLLNFNPHTLCRVWQYIWEIRILPKIFQSTHPLQGVTQDKCHVTIPFCI